MCAFDEMKQNRNKKNSELVKYKYVYVPGPRSSHSSLDLMARLVPGNFHPYGMA